MNTIHKAVAKSYKHKRIVYVYKDEQCKVHVCLAIKHKHVRLLYRVFSLDDHVEIVK